MNGKTVMKGMAVQLLAQINQAMDKGKITDNDPYTIQIRELKKHLLAFTTAKGQKALCAVSIRFTLRNYLSF